MMMFFVLLFCVCLANIESLKLFSCPNMWIKICSRVYVRKSSCFSFDTAESKLIFFSSYLLFKVIIEENYKLRE